MKPNLPKLLTLTLSLELILAPIAPAMADATKTVNDALGVTSTLLQSAGVNTMGIGGGANMGAYGNDLQMLEQQKIPVVDREVFDSGLLKSRIPGLAEYLASHPANLDCNSLKPLNVVEPDICEPSGSGIPADPRVSGMYVQQANAFKTHFKDIKNLYSDSSKEFQGAKACMTSATNVLENFFAHKLSELDKLSNELARMNSEFLKGSSDEKSEIAMATELLEGKDPELAKDIDAKFREKSLKDMQKEFSNPACNSLEGFKAENIIATGLKKTDLKLTADMDLKSPNGLNGADFTSKYGAVVADITKAANNTANYIKTHLGETGMSKGGMSKMIADAAGQVGSNYGIESLIKSTEYKDLTTEYDNAVLPLNTKQNTAATELASKFKTFDGSIISSLTNPNTPNFDSLLETMENKMRQECLDRTLTSSNGSLDYIKSKSYDPTKSKEANTNSSYIFDTELAAILKDSSTSPQRKLDLIKKAKKNERRVVRQNSWFNVDVLGKDGNKETKTIAKGNISASDFYSEVIQNCDAQFKGSRLKSSMTGQSAVETLKNLRGQYTKMANTQAEKLKAAMVKKLINCENSDIANSKQAGSCSPARFDTSKSGFCAAAANSCSINMQQCTAQTKQKVERLEAGRTLKVANYNGLVKNHMAALTALYKKTETLYENQIKRMQGGFPSLTVAAFSLPAGIDSDPKTTKVPGFDAHDVFLEDPAQAFAAFKNNVSLLKGEVTKYQTALMKGVKDHANKKVALYASVSSEAATMEQHCSQAVNGFQGIMAKKNEADMKLLSEFGEKLPEFCERFGTAHDRPDLACQGETAELVKSALLASNKLGSSAAAEAATEFQRICRPYGSQGGGSSNSAATDNIPLMCRSLGKDTNENCKNRELFKKWNQTEPTEPSEKAVWEKSCKGTYSYVRTDGSGSCSETQYKIDSSKCGRDISAANCDRPLAAAESAIKDDYQNAMLDGKTMSGEKITAATADPEFCVAEDTSHYRYNGKVLEQRVLGQQGGAMIGQQQ